MGDLITHPMQLEAPAVAYGIDEAIDESFPASDPPTWTRGTEDD